MERRSFLKGAALGAAAASATLAAPAIGQGRRELKLVTTWPKNYPGLGFMPERMAARVAEATDGQLTIKIFAAGELVPPFESFDAVQSGTADMYHGAEYYWQGKNPAFNFFTAVPFGMTAQEIEAWVHFGGGQELWDQLSARFGIKGLLCGNTGLQMGGWFRNPINTIDDLAGLKIRMPGLGGEMMRRVGATAVALPGGEIYPSLQSGAIDATEWVGPWNDLAFGFHRVVRNYAWPGIHEPGAALSLGIALNVWNDLTPGQRTIITAACQAENNVSLAEYNSRNAEALRVLIDQHGVTMMRLPEPVLAAFATAARAVIEEAAAADALSAEIYGSFKASLKRTSDWLAYADEPFFAARRLVQFD